MTTFKFYINIKKDFTSAEEILPKAGFWIYKRIINNIIWDGIIKHLGKEVLKDYSPIYGKDKATFTQKSEDIHELEIEKDNLESFLFGNYKAIKDNEDLKKAFSNRWLTKVYSHTKRFIVKKIVKDSVLTFLNSASIVIDWGIDPKKDI